MTSEALRVTNDIADEVYGGYGSVLIAYGLRLRRAPERAKEVAAGLLGWTRLAAVRAAAHMQLAGALHDLEQEEEALAQCFAVTELTTPRHMRGSLDLDFLGTFIGALRATGRLDAADAMRSRAGTLIARRAAAITDEVRREEFLRSKVVRATSM